ncbi:dienelactone hydrolase family protein [Sinorhizobium mexicanum]|uniref:Dienelactone hydrolase family protein n=1 Tax=Sinorhizobium mexicanum TaxID=375549 RepID=A0A859QDB8_9HYPH|nr:dienelactone hydrolase family protein [Sinorhizobium mexicanum]MBP1882440.1 carboxymethylenebutenolidase [Sinorhizobium mexicanum]QLL62132.1 dienelactone hydrolase family protein [Sinorhizobium mexicanum]
MRNKVLREGVLVSRRTILLALCGVPAGIGLLPRLAVAAPAVAADDPRVHVQLLTIDNGAGGLQSYAAVPATDRGQLTSIIVAHDALGLTPHFEDVARRLATAGSFAVLVPDYASRYGGTPAEPMPAHEVVGMTTWDEWLADTRSALGWLARQPRSNGKVAAIGFGLGGSALSRIMFQLNELTSGVIFYGRAPPLENVSKIAASLLLNYAGDDRLVNPQRAAFEDALKKAGVSYQAFVYEGAKHGFEDDTVSSTYSKDAAELAWERTMDFLKETTA